MVQICCGRLKRGWIIGIIGMCVILVSVGITAYGNYLTETYYPWIMCGTEPLGPPIKQLGDPDLYQIGETIQSVGPYFIVIGSIIMAIGLFYIWHPIVKMTYNTRNCRIA